MAKKLKFGSPAWRAKYMRKNRSKPVGRKGGARRAPLGMIRETRPRKNPPKDWTKVKAFRVLTKGGRKILEVKR